MTLETWLKIHTNVYSFVTERHTKPYKLFKIFIFLLNCKIRHASTTWKEVIRKPLCLPLLRNITEIVKKVKSLYGFGGRFHKITEQRFVWIFNHVSRVIT